MRDTLTSKNLKIGRINYLNLFPIFYGLEKTGKGYSYIRGHPSAVNRMLREGLLDVSPSSSIEYLRRPGEYELVKGHSISSRRLIKSILFFTLRPIEEVSGNVCVTGKSETSVALLEIVLKIFLKRDVRLCRTGETIFKMLPKKNSFLSIGDEALVAGSRARHGKDFGSLELAGKKYFVYDLGKLWHRHTGLSFVYALWIARREAVLEKAGEFARLKADLDSARHYAFKHLDAAARAARLAPLTSREIISYWRIINYGLGRQEKEGLELFRKYAAKLGLL